MNSLLANYDPGLFYDELVASPGIPRPSARLLFELLDSLPAGELGRLQKAAETALYRMGVTFTVYSDDRGLEKIMPFDIIPRVVGAREWKVVEEGLKQRITALNLFIDDLYGDQKILRDRIIPEELILSSPAYRPECRGLRVPGGIWCHITGSDLVRDRSGEFFVLEDNLRCPSGISYVLENRHVLKRTFAAAFGTSRICSVDDYPLRLLESLESLAAHTDSPTVVLLSPGIYNSAHFEHSFLAQQMGIELVEPADLLVADGLLYMRTTRGHKRVDVVYRRIDDDFLDPTVFRPDSLLGIPGIMEVYRSGRVALANAPGTGIADDKAVYAWIPKVIDYYLKEEPILRNVPTWICADPRERDHVLSNLGTMVVKTTNDSGGYGMLIGPRSSRAEQEVFRERILANPRNYIAQETLSLSRTPVLVEDRLEGRHVDLRPYILYGKGLYVTPGGLTRVALKKDSLVVNSSQGGGSKDTWVLKD
ncbi:MAG: circularly permuted type 2 ATP-grasp protein [Nitrospirae bacterium]|nr:circularly permuted type 2 ATP-grasp protein [Nitrospirota bacterium]